MAKDLTETVKKLMKEPQQIRNIAICAHIDHGKTTFSDNLLAGAGMLSEEHAGKQLALDFHKDEQERGITIDSSSVSMVHTINEKVLLYNFICSKKESVFNIFNNLSLYLSYAIISIT